MNMSNESDIITSFIVDIPIEGIIAEQDCISNFTELCKIKKRPGQDSAIKIVNYTCKTEWNNLIGEQSENASIYHCSPIGLCKGENKGVKHVLKYIALKGKTSYELKGIANEINIQQQIYKISGYTTPIYQIFLNNYYMMFVTDKLGITVYRYILQKLENGKLKEADILFIKKLIQRCYQLLSDLMTSYGIIHGDEHLNNFMLIDDFDKENFNANNVKLIDFGKSYKLSGKNNKNSIETRLDVIKSIFNSNINDIRYHRNCPPRLSLLIPEELK